MADPTLVFKVAGTAIDLNANDLVIGQATLYVKGGVPSLTTYRRGGAIPATDPYVGKSGELILNGTTYFLGLCVARNPEFVDDLGWVIAYQYLGLRHLGDYFPSTDDNTGMESIGYNLDPTDTAAYIAARAGRNVGQILTSVLTMTTNATNLNAYSLGAYTSLTPPTLPASTVADLAALTVIPQTAVSFGGEKFLGSVEAFLDEHAPNFALSIEPATGALRFLDARTFPATTFTLDSDPILPTELSRDVAGCFQRVEVRGYPVVEPWLLSLGNGQLAEDFTSTDKANFKPSAGSGQLNQDQGNCTCPGTTTVTITTAVAYTLDQLDQSGTGSHATVTLLDSSLSGLTMMATRRVTANTATSGGTSTLTLDLPLPVTSYNKFQLFWNDPMQVAWRKYKAVNTNVGAALQNQFSYPVPYVAANGLDAALTDVPLGSVVYGTGPAYGEIPAIFTQDPTTGRFWFTKPTYTSAFNSVPHDVRVFAAVATGANHATAPADISGTPQFEGTSHTIDGRTDTLIMTLPAWKDPGNIANMLLCAQDRLDSVKDAVVEGAVTYLGFYEPACTMGMAVNVTGSGFTTGWENCTSFGGFPGLAVVECQLVFGMLGGPLNVTTRMTCSNRRRSYSPAQFLRPDRTGWTIGTSDTGTVGGDAGLAAASVGAMTGGLNDAVNSAIGGANRGIGSAVGGLSGSIGSAIGGMNDAAGSALGSMQAAGSGGMGGGGDDDEGPDFSGFSGRGNNLKKRANRAMPIDDFDRRQLDKSSDRKRADEQAAAGQVARRKAFDPSATDESDARERELAEAQRARRADRSGPGARPGRLIEDDGQEMAGG